MSQSVEHRYSLKARRAGAFQIGPFQFDYEGRQLRTQQLRVDVEAPGEMPKPSRKQPLSIVISVPKKEIFLHEELPLDVTLFVGSLRVDGIQYPTITGQGFSLGEFSKPTQHQQTIDGQRFQVLPFRSMLIPLQSGSLKVGPATLALNVVQGRGFFGRRQPRELHSNALEIEVLPLPQDGRPTDFSGLVGKFSIEVNAQPLELKAGDPITLSIGIGGKGNFRDTGALRFRDDDSFRAYDPQAVESGGRFLERYEQVLIPKNSSVREIPSLTLSYFDPAAKQYRSVKSAPIAIQVQPAEKRSQIFAGNGERERVEKLGRDIIHIKDSYGAAVPQRSGWWPHIWPWIWFIFPLIVLAAVTWYEGQRRRLATDSSYARFVAAPVQAEKALDEAQRLLGSGDSQGFYDLLSRSIQDYLSAKLRLLPGRMDRTSIEEVGLAEETITRIEAFLSRCENVRFALGGQETLTMRDDLQRAREILTVCEADRSIKAPDGRKS